MLLNGTLHVFHRKFKTTIINISIGYTSLLLILDPELPRLRINLNLPLLEIFGQRNLKKCQEQKGGPKTDFVKNIYSLHLAEIYIQTWEPCFLEQNNFDMVRNRNEL